MNIQTAESCLHDVQIISVDAYNRSHVNDDAYCHGRGHGHKTQISKHISTHSLISSELAWSCS